MTKTDTNTAIDCPVRNFIHDNELTELLCYYDEFLHQVQSCKVPVKMRVVNINGKSGCGKDFIVRQLLEQRRINFYLTNPGHSLFTDATQIWRRLLAPVWKITANDSPEIIRQKINTGFSVIAGAYPKKDDLLEQRSLLIQLFTGQLSNYQSDPKSAQNLHSALFLILSATAYWYKQQNQKPFVIYLNNIDAFPEEFLNFFTNAIFLNSIDEISNAIFIITTADSNQKAPQGIISYTDYKEITIAPLSDLQIQQFLTNSGIDLPEACYKFILKLNGNLFFIKIFIDLYLNYVLKNSEVQQKLFDSNSPELELLDLYSGKNGPEYLSLFQIAALTGLIFSHHLVTYICQALKIVCLEQFFSNNLLIEELDTDLPDRHYRFRHLVIRDHYVNSVETATKKSVYDLLIAYYTDLQPEKFTAAEILSDYLINAGYDQQGIPYLITAIKSYTVSGSYKSAAVLAERLTKLLKENSLEWLEQIYQLGLLKLKTGNFDETIQILETGLNYLKRATDPIKTWQFLNELANAYAGKNDLEQTLAVYEKISRLAADIGDQEKLGVALNKIATLEIKLGRYPKAEKVLKHIVRNRGNFADPTIFAQAMASFGITQYTLGNYKEAYQYFEKGLDSLPADCDILWNAKFYGYLGTVLSGQKKYDDAMLFYQKQLNIAYQLGDHEMIGDTLGNMGVIFSGKSQYDKAVQHYKKQLAIYTQKKLLFSIVFCYNNIGVIYLNTGNLQQAKSYFSKVLDLSNKVAVKGFEAKFNSNLAETLEILEEYEESRKFYNRAIEIDLDNRSENFLLHHYQLKATLLFKIKLFAESMHIFRQILLTARNSDYNEICQFSLFMIDLIMAVTTRSAVARENALANLSARYETTFDDVAKANLAYLSHLAFKSQKTDQLQSLAVSYAKEAGELYSLLIQQINKHFIKRRLTELDAFLNN